MDPLSLIRNATIAKAPIAFEDGMFDFGNYKLPADTKTCFRRTLKSDDYFYTLKDVLFFLEHSSLPYPEYRRRTVEEKGVAVTAADAANLLAYLTGKEETCSQIDVSAVQVVAPVVVDSSAGKPAKSKTRDEKKKHGEEKSDKNEKPRKEHKRKRDMMSSSLLDPTDKAEIDADKPLLSKLREGEFAPFTRNSIFNITTQGVDFSSALKVFNDSVLKPKNTEQNSSSAPDASSKNGVSTAATAKAAPVYRTPVILVPKAITSEINLHNIKQFLEEGKFVKPQSSQSRKMEIVSRASPLDSSKRVQYKVLDDPSNFSSEDWERVVAVFVTGQLWQFRGWKYTDPANLFQHALGVHIVADERATDPTIATWNCKVLKVNSFKDHITTSASQEFWTALDQFVKYRKPQFDPSNLK